jgi:hypothetical protein
LAIFSMISSDSCLELVLKDWLEFGRQSIQMNNHDAFYKISAYIDEISLIYLRSQHYTEIELENAKDLINCIIRKVSLEFGLSWPIFNSLSHHLDLLSDYTKTETPQSIGNLKCYLKAFLTNSTDQMEFDFFILANLNVSNDYCTLLDHGTVPERPFIFSNINLTYIDSCYLVCRLAHFGEDKRVDFTQSVSSMLRSKSSKLVLTPHKYRLPYGYAFISLKDLVLGSEKEYSLPIVLPNNPQSFASYDWIRNCDFSHASAEYLKLNLHLSQHLNTSSCFDVHTKDHISTNPVSPPGLNYRELETHQELNELCVKLEMGHFLSLRKGSSVAVKVELKTSTGEILRSFQRYEGSLHVDYFCIVYQGANPVWSEKLCLKLDSIEQDSHLFFTFTNLLDHQIFAYGFLEVVKPKVGEALQDGTHKIALISSESFPDQTYLNSKPKLKPTKDYILIHTSVFSKYFCQNPVLIAFLKYDLAGITDCENILAQICMVEISDLANAFDSLVTKTLSLVHQIYTFPKYSCLRQKIFDCLIHVLGAGDDRNFTKKIQSAFGHLRISPFIEKELQTLLLESELDGKTKKTIKVWPALLEIIVALEPEQAAKVSVSNILLNVRQLMSGDSKAKMTIQALFIQIFPQVIEKIGILFSECEILDIMRDFFDSTKQSLLLKIQKLKILESIHELKLFDAAGKNTKLSCLLVQEINSSMEYGFVLLDKSDDDSAIWALLNLAVNKLCSLARRDITPAMNMDSALINLLKFINSINGGRV